MLGAVDWQAVGAVATGVAMLVTAAMAVFTAKMASATQQIAEASQAELDLLRRQTIASEAEAEQGQRALDATSVPALAVLRTEGDQIAATGDQDGLTVVIVNVGPVAANITEAKFAIAPQPFILTWAPSGPIGPGDQCTLSGEGPHPGLSSMLAGQPTPLTIRYEGPGGRPRFTRVTLKAKDAGDRWLVDQPEKHKDA